MSACLRVSVCVCESVWCVSVCEGVRVCERVCVRASVCEGVRVCERVWA